MGRQVQIGILEVPHVIGQNVQPDHVGPEHVVLLFGGVDAPPAGHAEDVQQACNAVEPVPPAAVQPDVFAGQPPAVHGKGALNGGLKVTAHGDENIDGNDDKGEGLEPVLLADAPLILDHHEADAADGGGIELGIVEPAVHVQIGGVIHCPACAHGSAHGHSDEVHRQCPRQSQEEENAALFGAPGNLVGENQPQEHQQPAQQLVARFVSVDLK